MSGLEKQKVKSHFTIYRNNAEIFKKQCHIKRVKAQYLVIIKDLSTGDLECCKNEINQELNKRQRTN
jgi:hypothetical protein